MLELAGVGSVAVAVGVSVAVAVAMGCTGFGASIRTAHRSRKLVCVKY